jgi:hypothetical protein
VVEEIAWAAAKSPLGVFVQLLGLGIGILLISDCIEEIVEAFV